MSRRNAIRGYSIGLDRTRKNSRETVRNEYSAGGFVAHQTETLDP
ncbi:hypothetical protein [Paenibacillus whitsoniae]|nr:hypothetical protein [Paenibacillus whitsoniae]